MDCGDVDDLLPGLALGAASVEERQAVESHLAGCDRHPQWAEFQRVAGMLPMTLEPVAPRQHVKQRLMARVYRDLEPPLTARGWRWAYGWVAAAAMALAALGLGIRDYAASRELASSPVQWQLQPTGAGVQARGSLVWLPAQNAATLVLSDLPALAPNDVYEVWLIKAGAPSPAGVFRSTDDSSASVVLKGAPQAYDTVAVTREPGPDGSAAPTSAPFIAAQLR